MSALGANSRSNKFSERASEDVTYWKERIIENGNNATSEEIEFCLESLREAILNEAYFIDKKM